MSLTASEMSPADIAACTGGGNNNGMGGFGGDGWWIILLFLIFGVGGRGYGGYGGNGGGSGGGCGCGCGSPCATQADLAAGFNNSAVLSGINGIDSALCQGFNGINTAILQSGYSTQAAINGISHQLSDCCCQTQRAIDGVNFNLAKGLCDLSNVINMQTRDIVDNANANYRGIMDFLVQEKISEKDAKIAELQSRVAISDQNAVIGARIDASVAEILRRTGNDCPTAAYLVNAPTPVSFPVNSCGQVQFGGNCGCGCGGGYGT